jgi:membrane-associated protease RseP (regulator of RpoE activity)
MRLVVGLVAVLLSGAIAHADGVKAPKIPLRVVRTLPDSHQALLFDKSRNTHVLADVGATIDGYLVEDIDDDEVTLSANGTQVVLAAPAPSLPAGPAKADLSKLAPMPLDPYGEPELRVRDVAAPADPPDVTGAPSAPTTASRPAPAPAAPAPAAPAPAAPAPADAAAAFAAALTDSAPPQPTPAPAAGSPVVLGRHEVDVALSDFGALAGAVHGSFTPAGAKLESLAPGSLFAKAGLFAGDTVTAVDGKPLRTLDDAADLYVRATTARTVNVSVLRAGKPLTLRLSIQ